jgi:hypothetical protein
MQAAQEWNAKILSLTTQIREKYPELYEHLTEMPVTNPDEDHPDIENKLKEYYDSLKSMMIKYAHDHPASFDSH